MRESYNQNIAQSLLEEIKQLPLTPTQKEQLKKGIKKLDKIAVRSEFRLNRIHNDKTIAINLLEQSIVDLEQQKSIIQAKNQELKYHSELLVQQSAKLEEHLRKLEISYSELEQFSYIASHDLKSPLRNIASFAQLLERRYKGKLDENADTYINFIVQNAKQMNAIICDLLEYSRTGEKLAFTPTALGEILDIVEQNLNTEIVNNEALITRSSLPEICLNRAGMVQVFQNLISNSIKFRSNYAPRIHIESISQNDYWLIRVRDNGLGMDESYQEKAFLPFQRINHLDRPGTGMGLAICKKVIKMHRGTIRYQSKIGEGTLFEFTLKKSIGVSV